MRIALADTVAEAALEIRLAEERAEYADEQRDAMEKTMETEIKTAKRMAAFEAERRTEERENRNAYYGSLFRHVGPIAAKPLANLLLDSPAWHAPRIAPLLARMGSDAEEALPALETIASDEAHQRRGVARYAEEAIDSIRAALRARDRVKDK